MNLIIKEIDTTNLDSPEIKLARSIFINYFSDQYKNIAADKLGIEDVDSYLDGIFEKTKNVLVTDDLHAFLAYSGNVPIGFATCGPLEEKSIILLRTVPINLNYTSEKTEIRKAFLECISQSFPYADRIIMMVRPANESYTTFCKQTGFYIDNSLFDQSDYLQETYDSMWYDVYVFYV